MIFKLLTEHHLQFLSFTGGCTGSSESSLVKIPHCWKSHVAAQFSRGVLPGVNLCLFVCSFCCLTSQVNSYGHGGTVSSPSHTFFLGKLEQAVNQYLMHILSLVISV